MPIQISCPACGRALRVPDELIGKPVKCPSCYQQFTGSVDTRPPAAPDGGESFRSLDERARQQEGRGETSSFKLIRNCFFDARMY